MLGLLTTVSHVLQPVSSFVENPSKKPRTLQACYRTPPLISTQEKRQQNPQLWLPCMFWFQESHMVHLLHSLFIDTSPIVANDWLPHRELGQQMQVVRNFPVQSAIFASGMSFLKDMQTACGRTKACMPLCVCERAGWHPNISEENKESESSKPTRRSTNSFE